MIRSTRLAVWLVLIALAGATLTSCADGPRAGRYPAPASQAVHQLAGPGQAATAATPPNPVLVLRRAGCVIAPDVRVGRPTLADPDSYYAGCAWGPEVDLGESLTVWTFTSDARRDEALRDWPRRDGETLLVGDRFVGKLSAACCGPVAYPVDPTVVAARLTAVVYR